MAFIATRSISIDAWNEAAQHKTKAFWNKQKFVFSEETEHLLVGHRGNLFNNFFACDPSLVTSTLSITCLESTKIDCSIITNTMFQFWSDWDKAFVELELATFESDLLCNDRKEALWARFRKQYNMAALKVFLTFGGKGFRMTPLERINFEEYLELTAAP